jgi:hypothetical protein
MRRRGVRYAELTSLFDVMYILVFAVLVQAAGLVQKARDEAAEASAAKGTPSAGEPADSHVPLRRQAAARLLDLVRRRGITYARISTAGVLTSIEVEQPDGSVKVSRLAVPLVQKAADPDVGLVYLGDENASLRLCSLVRLNLGRDDLAQQLVAFVPERPWDELRYALVEGMRRDRDRCFADEKGTAVVLDAQVSP